MRKRVNVEVKAETWKAIKAYAICRNIRVGQLVEEILHDYLSRHFYPSLQPQARLGKEAD